MTLEEKKRLLKFFLYFFSGALHVSGWANKFTLKSGKCSMNKDYVFESFDFM